MNAATPVLPHVDLPGYPVAPETRDMLSDWRAEYRLWAGMRARFALALMRTGQTPYVKPPGAEIARRRAANKRARKARRAGR